MARLIASIFSSFASFLAHNFGCGISRPLALMRLRQQEHDSAACHLLAHA